MQDLNELEVPGMGSRTEAALRESERRFRTTFAHAAVGIAVADPDYRFLEANPKFCEILGYTRDELCALTFTAITHPDDVAETQEQVRRLLAGEIASYVLEKRYLRKNSSIVWSRTTVTLLRNDSGGPESFIGVIEDVTDRKKTEETLREETRVLELLQATGTAIAAQLDVRALVQNVTDAATQLSGAKFGAFFYNVINEQGAALRLFTLSGAPREAFEHLGLPRNTPVFAPTFRGESVVRSADITCDARYGTLAPNHGMPPGHLPVRSYLAVPVVSRSGEVIGSLLFGHPEPGVFTPRAERLVAGMAAQAAIAIDNARLYEAAQQEIARRERAEAALRDADRRKDEFLATLAHELRNPLAPIRQAALISQAQGASEAQKRWSHDVIRRQVRHMALLLDDLLDISRITRGTLELRLEMTELAAAVDAAVETARPAIEAKRHTLSVELPPRPVSFAADALRLAQVLSNLLTNAAKYTDPDGQITLRASCNGDLVTISVTDTGIGISPDSLPGLFAMFSQVKSSAARSEGGLGIGLALAKGLVELHGGTIEAHSAGPERGSEFIVRLPLRTCDVSGARLVPAALAEPSVKRRVLIADDNRDAADSLVVLLQMEGHEVTSVHDGLEALAAFTRKQLEVALLDIGMPGLNGYEVAREIRRHPSGRSVVLIAVTGWGQDSDKAQAFAAGFDLHFTKPVDPVRLSELLRSKSLHASAGARGRAG
jgi:PAS domain S-box-containing protein